MKIFKGIVLAKCKNCNEWYWSHWGVSKLCMTPDQWSPGVGLVPVLYLVEMEEFFFFKCSVAVKIKTEELNESLQRTENS